METLSLLEEVGVGIHSLSRDDQVPQLDGGGAPSSALREKTMLPSSGKEKVRKIPPLISINKNHKKKPVKTTGLII